MLKTGVPSRGSRVRETWVETEPAPRRNESSPWLAPFPAPCSRMLQGDRRLLSRKLESGTPSTWLQRHVQQRGKERVAVEHDALCGQRGRALLHLFHHQAVRLVGGLEGEDPGFPGGLHDERVHLAAADGTERLLHLLEASAQPLVLSGEREPLCLGGHGLSRRCPGRGPGRAAPAPCSRGRPPAGAAEREAA